MNSNNTISDSGCNHTLNNGTLSLDTVDENNHLCEAIDAFDKPINTDLHNSIDKLKEIRRKHTNKIIIGNLNINSLINKFLQLKHLILKYVDILVVTETKLDETFLNANFRVEGFSDPYRLDKSDRGGGVMVFVKDTIASKLLTKHIFPEDIEAVFIKLNFRTCK